MTAKIDQKAYLQKYLSGPSGDKKKKKKKVVKGKGFRIIDDDLDLTKLRPLDGDELDILDEGEDAPQIAGIIDDRPEELKKLEQFKTNSKWKVVSQDDGFNSKLQIQEIKRDVKETEKENEIIFGKMYSDSEDEKKNDSDLSPPRKTEKDGQKHTSSAKKHQNHCDSDFSPPRKGREAPSKKTKSENRKEYDSDLSPPRKQNVQSTKDIKKPRKPSRWGDAEDTERRHNSSPKRRSRSPPLYKRQSDSDVSPPRKQQKSGKQKTYDSNRSPSRTSRKHSPKRRPKSPDSDISPPRKRKQSPERPRNDKYRNSNKKNNKKSYEDSDTDLSPPRKNRRQRSQSPPNKYRKHSPDINRRRKDSDSDLSPPRKDKNSMRERYRRTSNSPPPTNKKMARTLEGKMAGLQNAKQLKEENEQFRRKEDEAFNRMADDVSGRNAQVVSRKVKRETSEDRQKQREKAERQKQLDEKYKKWSKGLKQIEAQESRVQEFLHEASKPLARHKDDRDLEDSLKHIERDGDPMLQYIKQKKRERGELGPEMPSYKGSFPPNRFNIRPGYRWDGVDRSNGYEKKYFAQQSKKKAQEEEAYKWSTEDL
ncbi:BUD13 homolog [Achroia grisella]|uniref:BUD13 homolog n=1 Tax=Achroia grisella TaxID=688607 RepID=UPI0027D28B22|nr:BUD13 homolog [Achroia grisella]